MSLVNDIGTFLQDEGVGVLGVNLFTAFLPSNPDDCIALFEYAGSPPDEFADLDNAGLQVRVRASDYETAYSNIISCYDALRQIGYELSSAYAYGIVINDTFYPRIQANAGINNLGLDKNNRFELTQNFTVVRKRN